MAGRGRPLLLTGPWLALVTHCGGTLAKASAALGAAGLKASPRTLERWAAEGVPLGKQDALETFCAARGLDSPC